MKADLIFGSIHLFCAGVLLSIISFHFLTNPWLIWMSLTFLPAMASMSSKLGRNDTITASVLMLGMSSGLETIVAFMVT